MKIFHLSDLHLGKRVCSQSLIEDQKHILAQIIEKIEAERPDAVIIAGDVYDRSMPSEDAVELFDDFLYNLSKTGTKVLMISGNHDSAERLAFGGRIFNRNGIHISPEFDGKVTCVSLPDEHGDVNFYLLPFVTPSVVRKRYENEAIANCTDALRAVINEMGVDTRKRNVLIAHQFVTGADRTEDSETYIVGSAENVDAAVFDPFDYVALGHLHKPQSVDRSTIRYCGTPMKYSFAEVEHKKSITVLELGAKGNINIREIPLVPKRDWIVKTGKFDDLINESSDDFVKVLLTDTDDVINAMSRLREAYPHILFMDYERAQSVSSHNFAEIEAVKNSSPVELFGEFYKSQNNGRELSDRQTEIVKELFEEIAGGKNETDQA